MSKVSKKQKEAKSKIDPKKNHGPQARCKKCPNAKHNWSQCFLNPANPNNKLSNPEFMRKVQGNRKNFGNQHSRQEFYRNGQPYPYPLPPPPPLLVWGPRGLGGSVGHGRNEAVP